MSYTETDILVRLLQGEILLADGAAGTMLQEAGLPIGTPPDAWNLTNPEAIRLLHAAYLASGSQILLTNTFGANRIKLAKHGLEDQVHAINLAGARLAREAAGSQAYIAGDIGPTGELMEPFGALSYETALKTFQEQALALAEGGVDAIWVETMMDLEEARAAIEAAHLVTHLPVFCTLTFAKKGRTMMGASGRTAAERLWPLGLAAIGANCGDGLPPVKLALEEMRQTLPGAPLIAKPNAGLPVVINGQAVYNLNPQAFAMDMKALADQGVQIVGACCGSTPDFITAMGAVLHPDIQ